jgi:uncharacterized membrane protein SpoIIM required for sporulation
MNSENSGSQPLPTPAPTATPAENIKYCYKCGAICAADANFCFACGASFKAALPAGFPLKPFSKSNLLSVFRGRWLQLATLAFFLELVVFFLITVSPMSSSQAQTLATQGNQLVSSVRQEPYINTIFEIFTNNFRIASIELVPVLGWLIFGSSTYLTARIIEAFALANPPPLPGPAVMFSLLLLPHSWIELPAYAVATMQSILLVYSIFKRRFKFELARTLFVWLLLAVELFIAAVFEATEINLESYGALPLVTWLPFFALFGLAYVLIRRYRHSSQLVDSQLTPR